jgi:hypothetical protein
MQSEETFNNYIVDSFFSFPTAICMHYFDKHNKSYSHRNVAEKEGGGGLVAAWHVWWWGPTGMAVAVLSSGNRRWA